MAGSNLDSRIQDRNRVRKALLPISRPPREPGWTGLVGPRFSKRRACGVHATGGVATARPTHL